MFFQKNKEEAEKAHINNQAWSKEESVEESSGSKEDSYGKSKEYGKKRSSKGGRSQEKMDGYV